MDINNNAIGVQIAIDNPNADLATLTSLVKDALRNGDLAIIDRKRNIVIGSDGRSININRLKRYDDAQIIKKAITDPNNKKDYKNPNNRKDY